MFEHHFEDVTLENKLNRNGADELEDFHGCVG